MTDAEISRRLALAIGYKSKQIRIEIRNLFVWNKQTVPSFAFIGWHKFDYRDPTVIWPIAERFNCFPYKFAPENWSAGNNTILYSTADTAAKAVALAVIKAHEGAKK